MKDLPNAFWAAVFIAFGFILATLALYSHAKENIILAVLAFGSNIVTGAFAYIQGVKHGEENPTQPKE